MSTPSSSPEWMTAFDWERADPSAYLSATLSQRLPGALQDREWLRPELAQSESAIAFGHYVAELRHTRGWSRPQLAEQARVDPLAIALLEESALTTRELSPDLVACIARAFGLSVDVLAINPAPRPETADVSRHFGHWLHERLEGLLSQPTQMPSAAWRGFMPAGQGPLVTTGILDQTLALPGQTLGHDGTTVHALPVLEPADPPLPGLATLRVRLLDAHGTAVAGLTVELEMADLPFVSPEPSDTLGATCIPDLPLEMLVDLERLELRLS